MKKIIEKYNDMPASAKASIWFMMCSVLQKGLAFIVIPIYTRLLTTAEYGTFSVYNAWVSLVSVFATLSISSDYYIIAALKNNMDLKRMLSILQGCSIACTIVFFTVLYVMYIPVTCVMGLNMHTLMVMFVQILFSTPILFLTRREQYEFKYKLIVFITLTMSVLTILMSLWLINILTDKSNALILGSAIVQIFFGMALFLYNQFQGKQFYDGRIWKEAISFCIPLIPHNLAYFVLNSSDRVMIDRMCSTSEAGIYSLASQISVAIGIVTNALAASLNPWVLKKLKERDFSKIADLMNKLTIGLGVLFVTVLLIIPEILWVATSSDYHEAKWVMPPIMLGAFFLFMGGVPCLISLFHKNQKYVTIASIMAAIVNIALNSIFIPIVGYVAAAYTTMVSYAGFAIFHFIMAIKQSKKYAYETSVFNYKILALISVSTVTISLVMMCFYNFPLIRYVIVIVVIIVSLVKKEKLKGIIINIRREEQ